MEKNVPVAKSSPAPTARDTGYPIGPDRRAEGGRASNEIPDLSGNPPGSDPGQTHPDPAICTEIGPSHSHGARRETATRNFPPPDISQTNLVFPV